jgi:hypothetical protein
VEPVSTGLREDPMLEHLRSFLPSMRESIMLSESNDDLTSTDVIVSKSDNDRLVYQIPYRFSSQFKQVFEAIDADLAAFNVKSYIVRVSTLEEVFIEIGRLEDQKDGSYA